jgi:hypothetical protein
VARASSDGVSLLRCTNWILTHNSYQSKCRIPLRDKNLAHTATVSICEHRTPKNGPRHSPRNDAAGDTFQSLTCTPHSDTQTLEPVCYAQVSCFVSPFHYLQHRNLRSRGQHTPAAPHTFSRVPYSSFTADQITLKHVWFWSNSPQWARTSSFTRFLDHTQRRTTVGRTPVDEWSARRRDLYLTTHTLTTDRHPCPPSGIRTHNPSRRAAADPCLRPRGYWDRHTNAHSIAKNKLPRGRTPTYFIPLLHG